MNLKQHLIFLLAVLMLAGTSLAQETARVRFIHVMPDTPAIDVYVNNQLAAADLAYGDASSYLNVPGGILELSANFASTASLAFSQTASVNPGGAFSLVASSPAAPRFEPVADSLRSLQTGEARLSILHALEGGPAVDVIFKADGQVIAENGGYGTLFGTFDIAAGTYELALVPSGGDVSTSIADLNLPLSAGTSSMVLVYGTPDDPQTLVAAAPTAAATPDEAAGPTARVIVDADANLHLRQYPSVQARALGLVPSGTVLTVLGRRGPTEYYGGEPADEPVDLSDLESDPAEGLERFEDLEPADAWLYVAYSTPDGGIINAWMNALYLQVFDGDGERQRLASLDMVRQNQAGAAISTSITSPQPAKRVTARVYSLNPGVHLNIRIANDASSEIVGQAGGGAMLSFLGLDENDEWAFIEYQASKNVTIIGWVSAQYVLLQLDGNPIAIQALKSRDARLVPLIGGEARGRVNVAAGGEAPPPPTRNPVLGAVAGEVTLDPDANLHLRRMPHAFAESLALIPSGTRLIVDGITESGEWLKVTYEGAEGWVFAQYLALSFNNRRLDDEELERRLTLFDNAGDRQPLE